MERFTRLESIACATPGSNIDTDQIVPARFLQKPRAGGFGQFLFHDVRGSGGFVLNPEARILLAGENFGCGSSRENAVWALFDYGIRVVIAPSFGDIFFNNCLKNGLLPVRLPSDVVGALQGPIMVDLDAQTVIAGGSVYSFEIDPFARHCMLNGVDELEYTLSRIQEIEAFERSYK